MSAAASTTAEETPKSKHLSFADVLRQNLSTVSQTTTKATATTSSSLPCASIVSSKNASQHRNRVEESQVYTNGLVTLKQHLFHPCSPTAEIQTRSESKGVIQHKHTNLTQGLQQQQQHSWVDELENDPQLWKLSFSHLSHGEPGHVRYRLVKKWIGEWHPKSEEKLRSMCKAYASCKKKSQLFWVDQLVSSPDFAVDMRDTTLSEEERDVKGRLACIRGIYTSEDIFASYGIRCRAEMC